MKLLLLVSTSFAIPPASSSLIQEGQANVESVTISGKEITGNSLQLSDSNITISADKFQIDMETKRALFSDNVRVQNPDFILEAGQVVMEKNEAGDYIIVATEELHLKVMGSIVTAVQATYWPNTSTIVLTDSVVLDSEEQTVSGDLIEIILEQSIRCQKNCSIRWK